MTDLDHYDPRLAERQAEELVGEWRWVDPHPRALIANARLDLERRIAAVLRESGEEIARLYIERDALRAEVKRLTPEAEPTNEWWNKRSKWYQAQLDAFLAVARAAEIILDSTDGGKINAGRIWKKPCPHGVSPNYPTHAWWCDTCWNALKEALADPDVQARLKEAPDAR